MDKDAAINLFIKKYYKLLTDKSLYDRATLKKIKHDVFINTYKISGSVKDKEIAEKLIPLIIKHNGIKNVIQLDNYIQENTFLKYSHVSAEDYKVKIQQLNKEFEDQQILMNLDEEKKINVLKEQIIEQREPELVAEIENKKKQIELLDKELTSILDDLEFEEPISYNTTNSPLEWWEELNLVRNPFPSSNGFLMIDENLFGKILVDTPPFQWMIKKLTSSKIDIFGKGFLVDGALGTGKTTFFDFFKPQFILKNIEPLRIIITDKLSVAHYNHDFENQLIRKIKSLVYAQNAKVESENYEDMMYEMQISKGIDGFAIFIDDLHKNINQKNVFDFLSTLQLYKNRFIEYSINVVFFISGLPDWRERISLDQKLNSFFDGAYAISMPEVSPKQAAEALQKRLSAFSKTDGRSFQISSKFLHYIFDNEHKKRIIVGFRAYIDSAKKYFEEKQFDVIGVTPSNISQSLLEKIQSYIENNDFFKESINKLIYAGGRISNNTLHKCIDLIRHIYLETYVTENDPQFKSPSNLMLLKRLADSKFIIKTKTEKGAWKIHPILIELNNEIQNKYKYSLEDYLIQIYGIIPKDREHAESEPYILLKKKYNKISQLLSTSDSSILESIIKNIQPLYNSELVNNIEKIDRFTNFELSINEIRNIIYSLAFFIIDLETPAISAIHGKNNIQNWGIRFRNLEYFPDFLILMDKVDAAYEKDDSNIARIISSSIKAFDELLSELETSVQVRILIDNIPYMQINKNILSHIFNLSYTLNSQALEDLAFLDLARKYVNQIEKGFKEYLFLSSKLIFGGTRFKYYPAHISIKQYGVNYYGHEDCYNEFINLERSSFSKIFMSKYESSSSFFKYIIDPITSLWIPKNLEVYYNMFIEFDKIISHNETDRISFIRKNIRQFINLSVKLLSEFTDRIKKIIFEESFIYENESKIFIVYGINPRGNNVLISKEAKHINQVPTVLCKHCLNNAIEDSSIFVNDFFIEHKLELLLSDLEEMRKIVPGDKYPIQIGILIYLLKSNRIKPIQTYGLHYYFINNL